MLYFKLYNPILLFCICDIIFLHAFADPGILLMKCVFEWVARIDFQIIDQLMSINQY